MKSALNNNPSFELKLVDAFGDTHPLASIRGYKSFESLDAAQAFVMSDETKADRKALIRATGMPNGTFTKWQVDEVTAN